MDKPAHPSGCIQRWIRKLTYHPTNTKIPTTPLESVSHPTKTPIVFPPVVNYYLP